ncbi:MAG TPA: 1,4-dihydroxy-2-naphthoate polyprenyltransferase [Acidimicrobiia bacterium]
MTTASQWLAGARPRTLGAAVAPVLVGTSAAIGDADRVIWWRAAGALVVALALQVGVNYANDYSDGVRGTDRDRKGPLRLTATGLASPRAVQRAAAIAFAVAAVAGLVVSVVVEPLLLLVGVAAIAAAVLYTGGPKPYGYFGLGEVMVLTFFGFVATVGSAYVQVERVPSAAWWGSLVVGLLACAILLANNVRDVATDVVSGKRTLAVRIGARAARRLFAACYVGSFAAVVAMGLSQPWALLGLAALPLAAQPVRTVMTRTDPPALISALVTTSKVEIVIAVLVSAGLCLS